MTEYSQLICMDGWMELVSGLLSLKYFVMHWTEGRPVWSGSQLFQYVILFPGETLLQQKLQESNSRLYSDVGQTVRQVYGSASKEVG